MGHACEELFLLRAVLGWGLRSISICFNAMFSQWRIVGAVREQGLVQA